MTGRRKLGIHEKLISRRSSCLEVFYKRGVLKNLVKFTENHQRQSLISFKSCAVRASHRNSYSLLFHGLLSDIAAGTITEHTGQYQGKI